MSDAPTPVRGGLSIGNLLREARESRGESREDAARVTRIGKNYLAALEEDAFDRLPSPAYVKGFLRAYGKHLGLSPDDLICRYEERLGPEAVTEHDEERGTSSPRVSVSLPARNRWMIPLLLLVLVLITATIIPESDPVLDRPPPEQAPIKELLPSQSVQRPVSSAIAATLSSPVVSAETKESAPPETAVPSSVSGGMVLKLKVNQDCWLNITIDGAFSQQYDLKAGDLIEWKGERFFSLDLGNAGGVEAEFNGKGLPPFGEVGKSAHVVLPAEHGGEQ